MAIATANTTTVPRSTEGLILSAANPPMTPPNNAPTAITIAADQITLLENKKRTAAATFAHSEIICFKAFSFVMDS